MRYPSVPASGLASTATIRSWRCSARTAPRQAAVVVLPTPPLRATIAIVRLPRIGAAMRAWIWARCSSVTLGRTRPPVRRETRACQPGPAPVGRCASRSAARSAALVGCNLGPCLGGCPWGRAAAGPPPAGRRTPRGASLSPVPRASTGRFAPALFPLAAPPAAPPVAPLPAAPAAPAASLPAAPAPAAVTPAPPAVPAPAAPLAAAPVALCAAAPAALPAPAAAPALTAVPGPP